MTSTTPPPPSDETPDELDEFLAGRVRRALAATPPVDEQRRSQHLAAALRAYDDAAAADGHAQDDVEAGAGAGAVASIARRPRPTRSWWPAVSAAAAVLLIGVGAVAIAMGGADDQHNDAATAAVEDAADRSDGLSEASAAETLAAPASGADRDPVTPIDLGAFDSTEALADAVRARDAADADAGSESARASNAGDPIGSDPSDSAAEWWESTRSTTPCDPDRFGDPERFPTRFTARVAGVPHLVAVDRVSGRVVGVNLLTCAETES